MSSVKMRVVAYLVKPPDFTELCNTLTAAIFEYRNLRILNANRRRLQDWDREIERMQLLLQHPSAPDQPGTMRSYLRLSLRNLVVGLVELEALFLRDEIGLGATGVIERQNLLNALRKTIGVLQKTKDHFKSRELAELPGRIDALEKEQAGVTARLSDGTLYAAQPDEALRLQKRNAEIEDALTLALERWEALGARA